MSHDPAVGIEQRHGEIAHRPYLGEPVVFGKQFHDSVREVHQFSAIDHRRTGGAVQWILVVGAPLAVDEERERTQPALVAQGLGDPGAGGRPESLHAWIAGAVRLCGPDCNEARTNPTNSPSPHFAAQYSCEGDLT